MSKLAQSVLDSVTNKASASVLSEVAADWQSHFSSLKRHKSSQKLLKRTGPVVFGIELEKFLSDEYRPRVVLYNLIDNSSKLIRVIDQTISNQKGLEISIKYSRHAEEYPNACRLLEQQSRVNFFGKPAIEDIICSIITFIEKDAVANCFWSCEAVMQLSRLLNEDQKKEKYFEKGLDLAKNKIPAQILDTLTKGTEKWIAAIENLNVEKINTLIEDSLRRHKLEDIPD